MQSSKEHWLPVVGYEDLYSVSNTGKVRSDSRVILRSNGASQTIRERIRKTYIKNSGHLQTTLSRDGAVRSYDVHSLVARAFLGECPEGMEVRHLNGNAADNRVENLRYGTRSENVQDALRHGTAHEQSKTHCPRGHLYGGGNLRLQVNRKGYTGRFCRACTNAYGYAKYHGILDRLDEVADRYYEKYMQ